jgi:hypothetical protein
MSLNLQNSDGKLNGMVKNFKIFSHLAQVL